MGYGQSDIISVDHFVHIPRGEGVGGHSNTSVAHVRDQRFSKHTLIAISPLQQKHPLNEKFMRFCPKFTPKKLLLEDMFGGV